MSATYFCYLLGHVICFRCFNGVLKMPYVDSERAFLEAKGQERVLMRFVTELLLELERRGSWDKKTLQFLKISLSRKYQLPRIPRDYELLRYLPDELREKFRDLFKIKPVRTLSGVAVVAVMTRPLPCPGKCIYCPGGINARRPSPKSYTGIEPAARRAFQYNYDPFLQVRGRIKQLETIGHVPEKIEIIIMGGTFLAAPREYKESFIKGVYEGILGKRFPNASLEELKRMLETSKYRLVGLTIETRPDYCMEKHVDEMLFYGTTRVEIGVQTLDDEVLRFIKRGHDVETVRRAFRIAKDAGFKIVAHMMLNLPPSDPRRDLDSFKRLFIDPDFRPDMLKIYPTAVIEGTELYEMWRRGDYEPYSEETLIRIIAEIKKFIPPWVRIQRVQRDIPVKIVLAGYSVGHLRDVVKRYMLTRGWRCRCIRCREVGLKEHKEGIKVNPDYVRFIIRKYEASQGEELFLSYEDIKNDVIIGFLRLRKPSEYAHRPEIDENTMIVRELHVYGSLVPIGMRRSNGWQHRGFGAKLLQMAEKIAVEDYDAQKIIIISGIGVREYYRKFGYRLEGPYMSKKLLY